ncbi:MAG: prepilin peptidase [Ideonella sp.]|nr:prepilin peptidase [Ideonella sp.]MCC7457243.1 prepilin peptidase [Nitrospira sp.]
MAGFPPEWLLHPAALAILGLAIGSFLNVVVHRLPQILWREWWRDTAEFQLVDPLAWRPVFDGQPHPQAAFGAAARAITDNLARLSPVGLARPRSRCPGCGHVIRWYENIPLLGWIALRGRCSACKARISARYPIVELGTAALFVACGEKFGASASTLLWCTAVALLIAMALIDFDTTLLPDALTLPLVGLGLLSATAGWTSIALKDAVIGLLLGYFSLWLVAFLYRLVRGVEGMAEGDFKMLAGLGALLGWKVLPAIVLFSSFVGAAVGISLVVFRKHRREVPIPFGPYLAGGGLAAIFFGDALQRLYSL